MNKTLEKQRTKAAEKIIKLNTKENRNNYTGYKKDVDENGIETGKIVLTDGIVLYIGDPIVGINEVNHPEEYIKYRPFIKGSNAWIFGEENELNITDIKAKFKLAKAEYPKEKSKEFCHKTDKARVQLTAIDGSKAWYNAEYIITACDLVGNGIKIYAGSNYKNPCKIVGECGTSYIMPFIHTEN